MKTSNRGLEGSANSAALARPTIGLPAPTNLSFEDQQ